MKRPGLFHVLRSGDYAASVPARTSLVRVGQRMWVLPLRGRPALVPAHEVGHFSWVWAGRDGG